MMLPVIFSFVGRMPIWEQQNILYASDRYCLLILCFVFNSITCKSCIPADLRVLKVSEVSHSISAVQPSCATRHKPRYKNIKSPADVPRTAKPLKNILGCSEIRPDWCLPPCCRCYCRKPEWRQTCKCCRNPLQIRTAAAWVLLQASRKIPDCPVCLEFHKSWIPF